MQQSSYGKWRYYAFLGLAELLPTAEFEQAVSGIDFSQADVSEIRKVNTFNFFPAWNASMVSAS